MAYIPTSELPNIPPPTDEERAFVEAIGEEAYRRVEASDAQPCDRCWEVNSFDLHAPGCATLTYARLWDEVLRERKAG